MTDTIELIKQWGKDRGITVNGTHRGQWYKLVSEYGELCDNLAKGKDIKDDIGDMFVVLVMMCEIGEVAVNEAVSLSSHIQYSDQSPYFNCGFALLCMRELMFRVSVDKAADMIAILTALSNSLGHTLDDCIDIAYNDIKDRKGHLTTEGVFVKDGAA